MSDRYLIEVIQETITPVTIEAGSEKEALEIVLHQQGVAGDPYAGETKILSVRRMGK